MRKSLRPAISALHANGWGYRDIAQKLGCSEHYARAAVSRDRYGGRTPGDVRDRAEKLRRYHGDPAYRAYCLELQKRNYARRKAEAAQ
jgi:hypothetical protein